MIWLYGFTSCSTENNLNIHLEVDTEFCWRPKKQPVHNAKCLLYMDNLMKAI